MSVETRERHGAHRSTRIVAPVLVLATAWIPAILAAIVTHAVGTPVGSVLRLAVTALVYAPVAAIVLARRRYAVALLVSSLAVTSGLAALAVVLDRSEPAGPEGEIGVVASILVVVARQAEIAALAILLWLFVRSRVRRWGIAIGATAIALDIVIWAVRFAHVPVERWVVVLPAILALAGFPFASSLLVRQWWRGSSAERATLSWFTAGAILLVASYLRVLGELPPLLLSMSDAAFVLAQGFLPTAILAASIGASGTLADRRLVNGVVWAQSFAVAIGLYVVLDALAVHFGIAPGFAGGVAAAVLALLFNRMLRVIRRRTALVFIGPGADARAVLTRVGESLRTDDPRGGLDSIAASLRAAWHLDSITIAPPGDGDASRCGEDGPFVLDRELELTGRTAGRIRLTASDAALLNQVVAPVLDAVAPLIAIAAMLAEANHDTEATRRRIIAVRREERKLLHRHLHDEIAPALAGIAFAMRGAAHLIDAVSTEAVQGVEDARLALSEQVDDVRRLARALLPVALDAGDLEGALHELARRFSAPGSTVRVQAAGSDALDSRNQIALYLALTDALDVVRRELPQASVTLEVAVEAPATARLVFDETGAELGEDDVRWEAVIAPIMRHCADAGGCAKPVVVREAAAIQLTVPS